MSECLLISATSVDSQSPVKPSAGTGHLRPHGLSRRLALWRNGSLQARVPGCKNERAGQRTHHPLPSPHHANALCRSVDCGVKASFTQMQFRDEKVPSPAAGTLLR